MPDSVVSPLPFDGERPDLIALLAEMYDAGCEYAEARESAAHDLASAQQKRDADEDGLRFQAAKDRLAAALLEARKDAERWQVLIALACDGERVGNGIALMPCTHVETNAPICDIMALGDQDGSDLSETLMTGATFADAIDQRMAETRTPEPSDPMPDHPHRTGRDVMGERVGVVWRRTTIRIRAGRGTKDHFAAWVSDAAPGLAVNSCQSRGYTITHIASGERLPVLHDSRAKVGAAALQLARAVDWREDAKSLYNNETVRVALAALPHEVRENE